MNNIAVLTPSFQPDFARLVQLHKSVLEFTDPSVVHHVIVPRRDLAMFRKLESARLRVRPTDEFLPAGMLATDSWAALLEGKRYLPHQAAFVAVNLRRPWPPVRGWIMQQMMKLAASTQMGAKVVVLLDSDVVLLRPLTTDLVFRAGSVRCYEKPESITPGMGRHLQWTRTAYRLLGLNAPPGEVHPDYVAGITTWDPSVVSACLSRVEEVAAAPWFTTLSSQLHFSECILYGTFLRHFGTVGERAFVSAESLCHSYWDMTPLTGERVDRFIAGFGPSDVAVHIQSNSVTPEETKRRVVNSLRAETR